METPRKYPVRPEPPAGFLDLIDGDPEQAREQFYLYFRKLLRERPPVVLFRVPRQSRDDLLTEIVLRCWNNDQQLLRSYRGRNIPFSRWLRRVARQQIRNYLRRQRRSKRRLVDDPGERLLGRAAAPAAETDGPLIAHELNEILRTCMARLEARCRILIASAAVGFKAHEIAVQLGYPPGFGPTLSKQLHRCRQYLKTLMGAETAGRTAAHDGHDHPSCPTSRRYRND